MSRLATARRRVSALVTLVLALGATPASTGPRPARERAPQESRPSAWRIVPVDTKEPIRVVRIDAVAGDLWLLAGTAILHRRKDGTWAPPLLAPGKALSSFHVVRPGLVYATAPEDATVLMHRGGSWSSIGQLERCIWDELPVHGRGETVVAGCAYYSGLADWSSQNPASLRARYDVAPRDLVLVGPGEALTLGVAGLFLVRLGEPDPVRLSSEQVSGHRLWADRRHIVVVGRQGRSYHASWDPAQATAGPWAVHDLPDSAEVAAIWGSDPDDLLAVGRGGLVLRFDGTSWSAVKPPTRADLLSVDGDGSGLWVGGAGGTLLHHPLGPGSEVPPWR